jgi:5-methyltetrahydrofolate--homocysteine methyltransferase|tara:strand:+ start:7109 stop:8086 length:978 start_codon:yes stop_codon:yes gene_type:complete
MDALATLLDTNGFLVIDGAMGTELFAAGLMAGDPPEIWNLDHPDRLKAIHRSYVEAGSDIILTNSFGGNRHRLKLHSLEGRVHELNAAAASICREVADAADRRVLVAGSMGPTGELIEPLGELTTDEAQEAFAEQAAGLTAGGADVLWLETMSALTEVEAGVSGARSASDLPIVVTLSFDTAGRTMMGITGEEAGTLLADLGVNGIGANCGANLADTEAAVAAIRSVCGDIPVVSKANAGIPVWKGAELEYDATPEILAAHAHRLREIGVSIIGACCGSTSAHIAMIRAVLDGHRPVPDIAPPIATATVGASERQDRRRRGRRQS